MADLPVVQRSDALFRDVLVGDGSGSRDLRVALGACAAAVRRFRSLGTRHRGPAAAKALNLDRLEKELSGRLVHRSGERRSTTTPTAFGHHVIQAIHDLERATGTREGTSPPTAGSERRGSGKRGRECADVRSGNPVRTKCLVRADEQLLPSRRRERCVITGQGG